eukprot:1252478-Rhodomonas_salina.4
MPGGLECGIVYVTTKSAPPAITLRRRYTAPGTDEAYAATTEECEEIEKFLNGVWPDCVSRC